MACLQDQTTIVIVGGGEVGLITSILLSLQGIKHVLFERQPTTSIFPKAIGIHNRTVEILRLARLEDIVAQSSASPESYRHTRWITSLGPAGRTIARREAFGYVLSESDKGEAYAQASPSKYLHLAQIRLEPILRRRAEELNSGGLFFHHEVTAIQECPDHAIVSYHDRSMQLEGHDKTIQATFVVGADGGRFVTEHVGLNYEGESDLAEMVTAHIRAPLMRHLQDDSVLINWFVNPHLGGSTTSGVLYHLGPYPRDPATEEYSVLFGRLPHELDHDFTREEMLTRLHKIFQIPDLEIELLSISHWMLQAKWASSFISPCERVFLVGDAAHRTPPWGALGGNTGFQDAHNLVWKLTLALRNGDGLNMMSLLRSYDEERRPIGKRVAASGLANSRAHSDILDRAIGLSPSKSEEENVAAMESYFHALSSSDSDGTTATGKLQVEAVRNAAHKTLDIEFFGLGAEAGWFYDHSHVFDDEDWVSPQVNSDGKMEMCGYRPCTVPGHQLPHAWLQNAAGEKCSTRWLVKQDNFVLLTSSTCWEAVEHELVEVIIIDGNSGGWMDIDNEWGKQRQIAPSGAVLIRPDNLVAWRWMDGRMLKEQADPSAELDRVMRRVLRLDLTA